MNREKYYQAAAVALQKFYGGSSYRSYDPQDAAHLESVAANILMARDGMNGGSFADAVVRNDLAAAVGRADDACLQHLAFLVYCRQYVVVN
jgi:hypothetical protein